MVTGLKSNQYQNAGLQSLADYIAENHDGNNSDFARAVGVERHQVQQWLKAAKPVFVIDGKLVAVLRDIESNN